jgi:tRNA nucleotidyltransferase (CCA-adding enzyme)
VEHQAPDPLVRGRDLLALGLSPGPRVGEVLKQIYERQLDGEIVSVEQGIEAARAILDASRQ